jgi:SAM-dependent methyltransferase
MDVTNRFVLEFAKRFATAKVLDFGCGTGEVVTAGRAAGLDIIGADVFYGGAQTRPGTAFTYEIRDGRIPFDDASFDLVTNNQVLEHVEDLEATLGELRRVLKPGGSMLSIFPSRDVFREGHIGVPFAHWFPRGSRLRFYYTWALRTAGLGTWKEQATSRRQWAVDKLEWIDTFTHYRPRKEVLASFNRYFVNELREQDYIRYRLGLAVPSAACAIFRKLAFLVIVSRKEPR